MVYCSYTMAKSFDPPTQHNTNIYAQNLSSLKDKGAGYISEIPLNIGCRYYKLIIPVCTSMHCMYVHNYKDTQIVCTCVIMHIITQRCVL